MIPGPIRVLFHLTDRVTLAPSASEGTEVAERETISPADAARVRGIISELGLNSSTTRYLGITARNVPRLERMGEGRAKVTAWEVDTIRLVAGEREHIRALQEKNRRVTEVLIRPKGKRRRIEYRRGGLSDIDRDKEIRLWLQTGKFKDVDQTVGQRKGSFHALEALGFDKQKPMPYRRKARSR